MQNHIHFKVIMIQSFQCKFKDLFKKERVNSIWGSLYHQQSRAVAEAFNKTILKFLYLDYGENKNTFELNRTITASFYIIME